MAEWSKALCLGELSSLITAVFTGVSSNLTGIKKKVF